MTPGSGPDPQQPQPERERTRFTSRAAVLAVVICAVALSLAYPVREYIAQVRQIDQLQAHQAETLSELHKLQAEQRRLGDPAYVEQLARDRLHMCMPSQTCYVIIGDRTRGHGQAGAAAGTPWYDRLWGSVRQADRGTSR
ncbi:MAG: septum formation initiator family protein [Actinobacteria bacterium]|nr:septum formation initiator family protein [Actinomycetota bacterium]